MNEHIMNVGMKMNNTINMIISIIVNMMADININT